MLSSFSLQNANNLEISDVKPIHLTHGIFRCHVGYHSGDRSSQNGHESKQFAMKSFGKSRKSEEHDQEKLLKLKKSFRREYELLTSFCDSRTNAAHQRIVSAYWYSENYPDYGPLFLMELGERSLFDVLTDNRIATGNAEPGRYSFRHCLSFLSQVAEALVYLHNGIRFKNQLNPIIHRDLKSCNILMFNQGRECKICDFDISKPVEDTMSAGVGSPGWRAPELVAPSSSGMLRYTVSADCFSFGIIICETLFRKKPENIGQPEPDNSIKTASQRQSKVQFFSEQPRVLYLCESVFFESPEFNASMRDLQALMNGVLSVDPNNRSAAQNVLENLQLLQPRTSEPLPALYGYEVPLQPVCVGEHELNEPVILENTCCSEPSQFISVFFTVEKASVENFLDEEKERIRSVMSVMIETINTRVGTGTEPCTAKFAVCLVSEDPRHLILEIKVRQSNQTERSVVSWCQNNDEQCANLFKSFFAEDPRTCLQSLSFSLRTPEGFMPDCGVNEAGQRTRRPTGMLAASWLNLCSLFSRVQCFINNFE